MIAGRSGFIVPVDKSYPITFVLHELNGIAVVNIREKFFQCCADFQFTPFPEIILGCASGREWENFARHCQQCEQRGECLRVTPLDLIAHAQLHVINLDRSLFLYPDRNIDSVFFSDMNIRPPGVRSTLIFRKYFLLSSGMETVQEIYGFAICGKAAVHIYRHAVIQTKANTLFLL